MVIGGNSLADLSRLDLEARRLGPDATPATRPRAAVTRPAWVLLYALLPLCVALFALLDYVPASDGVRTVAEGVIVTLVIGLAALWVRANRRALSRLPAHPEAGVEPHDITVEVHEATPRVIHLTPRRNRSER